MKSLLPCVAAGLLALLPAGAMANGLVYDLPEDGSWASYEFSASMKIFDQDMKMSGTIRVASVGKTVEGGKPCRWIEVKMDGKGPRDNEQKIIAKALVPEDQLGKGKSPLKHAIRAYQKDDDGEMGKLKNPSDAKKGPLPLILAAPLEQAETLEPEVVSSKLGELPCPGEKGALAFVAGGEKLRVTMANRLNPKAPFGVVAATWEMQIQEGVGSGMEMHWELKLTDTGKGAKTELPDAK